MNNLQQVATESFDYLLEYASDDWVGLSVIVSTASSALGEGATQQRTVELIASIVARLIDYGAVPGDLTEADPGFIPWSGSKEERVDRLRAEIGRLGRLPYTGEICWIHSPAG